MDGTPPSGMFLRTGVPECFKDSPPLDSELLDSLRPLEASIPEGIYSAQLLGISEERHDPASPIALIDSETRLDLIRACIVHISHNLGGSEFQNFVQYTIFYDGDRISENADASNDSSDDGSMGNQNVINNKEPSENAHSIERQNAYSPEVIGNSALLEQAYTSDTNAISGSDNPDKAELYWYSDGEDTHDFDASQDMASRCTEMSSQRYSMCNINENGAVLEGNFNYIYNTEKSSLQYNNEQPGLKATHIGKNYSDYTEKPPSRGIKARTTTTRAPSKAVKSSSQSNPGPVQKLDENLGKASPHLIIGDYFRGSTRLLAKKLVVETNPQSSLGKRSRDTAVTAGLIQSGYAGNYDHDHSDAITLAKKARTQQSSRCDSSGEPRVQAVSRQSIGPTLQSLDPYQPLSAEMTTSYNSETMSDCQVSYGNKVPCGGRSSYGGKISFGGEVSYEGEVSYGGGVSDGKETPPDKNTQYGGKGPRGGKIPLGPEEYTGRKSPLGTESSQEQPTLSNGNGPEPEYGPPTADVPLVPNTGRASNNSTSRGKRPWTEHEHAVLEAELKALRNWEAGQSLTGKLGLRDEKLWAYISKALKERYDIDRSLSGAKYYWGRFGRAKSGFDERAVQDANNLSTSVQHKKTG